MSTTASTSVLINAEQSTVWKFMSEPEKFLAWMTFLPGSPAPAGSAFEPKPGGALRIVFPNGGVAKGSVVEIDPPRKLVFTWGYDPDVAKTGLKPGACRVELALQSVADGTLVTLTHTGPMSDDQAASHKAGWRHYLSQLAVQSAMAGHQSHIAATLDAYFKASMEPDQASRDALLASCCTPDIRVRTQFACTDSVPEFSAQIANGLRHMPGAILAQNGIVRHIHGFARVPWKVSAGVGKVMFKGENVLRFTPSGKITEIVSFPD